MEIIISRKDQVVLNSTSLFCNNKYVSVFRRIIKEWRKRLTPVTCLPKYKFNVFQRSSFYYWTKKTKQKHLKCFLINILFFSVKILSSFKQSSKKSTAIFWTLSVVFQICIHWFNPVQNKRYILKIWWFRNYRKLYKN